VRHTRHTHSEERGKEDGEVVRTSSHTQQLMQELLAVQTPRKLVTSSVTSRETAQSKMGHHSYAESIKKKPQRGEWFHSFGVHSAVLKVLEEQGAVEEEHLALARDSGVERPKMQFVKGDTPLTDYLFILSHELKFEAPAEKRKRQEEVKRRSKEMIRQVTIMSRTVTAMNLAHATHNNRVAHSGSEAAAEAAAFPPPLGSPPDTERAHAPISSQAGDDELEAIEEHQLVIFFFPARNLLISIGDIDTDSALVEACRNALRNPMSAVLSDLCRDDDGSDGCGTLMVVMLDATIDQVFPIMDEYSDALEGLRIICQADTKYEHLRVSTHFKFHVAQIRRYLWDVRGEHVCACVCVCVCA